MEVWYLECDLSGVVFFFVGKVVSVFFEGSVWVVVCEGFFLDEGMI